MAWKPLSTAALAFAALLASADLADAQPWSFSDDTATAGVAYVHGYVGSLIRPDGSYDEPRAIAGGVAAGDYDDDGRIDLYAVAGDVGPNLLFRNLGDGSFEEVGALAEVDLTGVSSSGPVFADVDGDGLLDLFVGGVGGTPVSLFRNQGDGTFEDVTATSGLLTSKNVFGGAFGDFDRDGDLDLALAHWATPLVSGVTSETLWRNDGGFTFTDVSLSSGIQQILYDGAYLGFDLTFTPNFADIDADGWLDLLLANDFKQSKVLHNEGDGTFSDYTDLGVITDENGMGGAVGDYDNDGVLDWFVSSIFDPAGVTIENWGVTGNRLYRGVGDGTFVDATDAAGVREGFWGWGATFADLNNDGWLDLFHTNGWGAFAGPPTEAFFTDPARLFVSNRDGTFDEESAALGAVDTGQGRGVVAFDQERDGDLDLFVSNNRGPSRFFRNALGGSPSWLTVRLQGLAPNTEAIGARVQVTTAGGTQMREIRAGSNFESQDPAEAHFGLGGVTEASRVRVVWPLGGFTELTDVAVDQVLDIAQTTAACGNGVVESTPTYGEECDEGAANGTPGSDCLVNCLLRPTVGPCTAFESIDKPRLRVTGVDKPGHARARVQGTVDPPAGWSLDPVANGLRAFVENGLGEKVLDHTLPPGAWSPAAGVGWRVGQGGSVFLYRGESRAARVSVKPQGTLSIRITTKYASYDIDGADEPLSMTFVFDALAASTDACARAAFAAPDCTFKAAGQRLRCR